MKRNLLISIWMTLATTVLLGIIYPSIVTGLAQVIFPRQANGESDSGGRQNRGFQADRAAIYRARVFSFAAFSLRAAGYDPTAIRRLKPRTHE